MKRRWLRGALVVTACAGVLGLGIAPGSSEVDGDSFISDRTWNIRLSAPTNWRMSEQKSYTSTCTTTEQGSGGECLRSYEESSQASILLWMHRRNPPGKMLLAAERLPQQTSSREYARKTRALLTELGFTVGTPQLHAATGAYWLEFDNGSTFLRQALLVSGRVGYSLTLSALDTRTRTQHLRAFDFALRSIRIDRDSAPAPAASDGSATPATPPTQATQTGSAAPATPAAPAASPKEAQ